MKHCSGAGLYDCDSHAIVNAVSKHEIANALDHEMRFVFVSRCSFFQTGLRKSSDCISDSEPSELKLDRAFRRFPWEGKAATSFSVAK